MASVLILCSAPIAFPQSTRQQQIEGVVASNITAQPVAQDQPPSSYARFIDPVNGSTADELVRYAMAHNGELTAARQMIAEARGKLKQAGLKPNPMVMSSYGRTPNTPDNNIEIGMTLPLELGGRRDARINVALREIELREAEAADFERRLAAEVRLKYSEAIAAARNLKFTEDLLSFTRDSHRLIEARVERGKSAPLESNTVLVEMNRVDAMRINFESKTEVAMLELKKTIGMMPDEQLRLRGEFNEGQPAPSWAEAIRNALASRPDLAAARAAESLALAQIEQAKTEGKVEASLFANYMRQSMGFDARGFNEAGVLVPVQGVFHYLTFGVQLTLPVRNKNQGMIEMAEAQLEAARNRLRFGEIVVRNEVAASLARFERAKAALAVYRDGVRAQAVRNLEVVKQTYVLGQKSLIDYLAEQRRLIEIETGYTEVLKEYFDSLVEIERAAALPVPTV